MYCIIIFVADLPLILQPLSRDPTGTPGENPDFEQVYEKRLTMSKILSEYLHIYVKCFDCFLILDEYVFVWDTYEIPKIIGHIV